MSSEVKRYMATCDCMRPASWGDYVRHSDYAALETECERLADELARKSVITGDCIARCQRLADERDALRQQLAERDAEILEQRRLKGMGAERELKLMSQRDKLAGLLREAKSAYTTAIHWTDMRATMALIDAALSELTP